MSIAERVDRLNGTFTAVEHLSERLRFAAQHCHLLGAVSASKLPEGCAVAIGVVRVDPAVDAHDVGGGKYSLLSHTLYRLAQTAGIAFDPDRSGRVDDGSDPHYCKWRAVGARRDLDGSVVPVVREKVMDLRDGSPMVAKIRAESKDDASFQRNLRMQRAFLEAHAQTKAEQRVIRKLLGLRSYTREELERPFAVVKLQFTGHSDDPEIRRANAAAIRDQMLGGVQAMFGPPKRMASPVHALEAASPAPLSERRSPPPPVGVVSSDDEEDDDVPVAVGMPQTSTSPGAHVQAAPPAQETPASDGPRCAFGRGMQGKLLSELKDKQLDWYRSALAENVADPNRAAYLEQNKRMLAEVDAEIARRKRAADSAVEIDRGDDPDAY
jgi:hypothetical protein